MRSVETYSWLRRRGFTLIEIMVVVALMGLIATMAIPNIYQLSKKEGMRRAVSDLIEVCSNARAQAILRGKAVDVIFHPLERRFEVSGATATVEATTLDGEAVAAKSAPAPLPGTGLAGVIPEDVVLEMLDVNLLEYNQSEWTRVRFYPNGTSDEMTVVFHSDKGDFRKITLEPTTGLATQGPVK